MSNQEKAKAFLQFHAAGDMRCKVLLMMLSLATGLGEAECFRRIQEIAQ